MTHTVEENFEFTVGESGRSVSGLVTIPRNAVAAYVFAHGAGAGMHHAFMTAMSGALVREEIAVLRFNFPYMESGRRTPDRRPILIRTVRSAIEEASIRFGDLPLFAGGKSMGGRMTSLAQAAEPLPGVRGLVFMGFPLHAAGKPDAERASHLGHVSLPLLFFQGTRDRLAEINLIRSVVDGVHAASATLVEIKSGDHSLHVPKRSGLARDEVLAGIAGRTREWMSTIVVRKRETQ